MVEIFVYAQKKFYISFLDSLYIECGLKKKNYVSTSNGQNLTSMSKFGLLVILGQKLKVLAANSFCTYLLVHVSKKKEKTKKNCPDPF